MVLVVLVVICMSVVEDGASKNNDSVNLGGGGIYKFSPDKHVR